MNLNFDLERFIREKVTKRERSLLAADFARYDAELHARIDGKRTPAGVFTNHSCTPNAHFEAYTDGDLNLVASQNIYKGEEVTLDYRQAASVNGLQPDRLEVTETMRQRLVRLKVERTAEEIGALVDVALQRFGYLPSFPAFLSLIPDPNS